MVIVVSGHRLIAGSIDYLFQFDFDYEASMKMEVNPFEIQYSIDSISFQCLNPKSLVDRQRIVLKSRIANQEMKTNEKMSKSRLYSWVSDVVF